MILARNGSNHVKLQEYIYKMDLSESVKMIGYGIDLDSSVVMGDIAVSLGLREGLGLNLIEAM